MELIDVTGLTESQVRRGLTVLRESLPGLKDVDGVYSYEPGTHRYHITYVPEVVDSYEIMRLRGEAKRSYRMLTGTILPHAKHSRTKQLRLLRRHLQLIVDEANDILEPAD
ncbi:hypothetical protein [Streptomyces alkaliterrae]|uniref:Uncharacterized protein n=1 Tax=Streptomyces alkaliterrae TaxID=2213162 RepID=A0A5P0YQ98_9ACTN|nr:hypothetical protein [Streptomyces alkaliterrae]MBB1258318.1 hypothetical protein [Streptomyces alkaliterrae]MQS00699.1 hypothetical protein [Streptomyces alkaliterrae]